MTPLAQLYRHATPRGALRALLPARDACEIAVLRCDGAAMSCWLARPPSLRVWGEQGQRRTRATPAVLCSTSGSPGAPRDRRVALSVELETVRSRAQSAAARGRRLSEKATLLRQGEARAAADGDAASVARLQRDRAVVLTGLAALLRRVRSPSLRLASAILLTRTPTQLDIYRQFASKVEEYLERVPEAMTAPDDVEAQPAED